MTPYYQDDLVTIYHGDAIDVLPHLPAASLVLTDPPFFVPVTHYGGGNYGTSDPLKSWGDASVIGHWWGLVLDTAERTSDGSVLTFCSDTSFAALYAATYRRFDSVSALVWDKGRIGTGRRWRRQYELVMYARPTGAYWGSIHDRSDMLRFSPVTRRDHPVEKPVPLLIHLIEPTTPPNGLVLDPFMGSGATLLAARATGRQAIGIEIEERYCEVAAQRCSQEVLGLAV